MRRNRQGFTLVELLIVLVIIGIVVAVALPKFWSSREDQILAPMRNDLESLGRLQERYYSDAYRYAEDPADPRLGFTPSPLVTVTIDAATAAGWKATATHEEAEQWTCTVAHGNLGSGEIACVQGEARAGGGSDS